MQAVVLLSGGLDSATTFAIAKRECTACYALSFHYGQRHKIELSAAKKIAALLNAVEHRIVDLDLGWMGGSALTDTSIAVPETPTQGIPVTYVPARNTIFLAYALGYAEMLGSRDIYIGVNAVDYSGYPDCRPEYIQAFENLARLATRAAVEGEPVRLHTPLIHLSKAEIIKQGVELGVDYSLTVSCYQADTEGRACGRCDSCRFRKEGFKLANIPDPTRYQQ